MDRSDEVPSRFGLWGLHDGAGRIMATAVREKERHCIAHAGSMGWVGVSNQVGGWMSNQSNDVTPALFTKQMKFQEDWSIIPQIDTSGNHHNCTCAMCQSIFGYLYLLSSEKFGP